MSASEPVSPERSEPRLGARARPDAESVQESPSRIPETAEEWAGWCAARGWHVFPTGGHDGKVPLVKWRDQSTTDPATIHRWGRNRNPNVGIDCDKSGLLVLDEDGEVGLAKFAADHGVDLPETFRVRTGKGMHAYFRLPALPDGVRIKNTVRIEGYDIDVRAGGGFVVGPGSVHKTGSIYGPVDPGAPVADLPTVLVDALPMLDERVECKAEAKPATRSPRSPQAERKPGTSADADPVRSRAKALGGLRNELSKVRSTNNGSREHTVNRAGLKLGHYVGGGWLTFEEVYDALLDAATVVGWVDDENRERRSKTWAQEHIKRAIEDGMKEPDTGVARDEPEWVPLDDSPLAEWLAGRLGDRFCWAGGLGWREFDGKRWREVEHVAVREATRLEFKRLYKADIDRYSGEQPRLKALPQLLTKAKIDKATDLLKGIIGRPSRDFDRQPDLLNVGNGVVDLRTSELLPHSADYLFTKITGVDFKPRATHRDWDAALEALADAEVIEWMQWRFGQAATGHMTPDDTMPVLKGTGENGKTTVVAAIREALGEHAVDVPERALMANPSDHPTELMVFQGARLAILEEAPEGRRLNVKRLKDVVGTPSMTARAIRQNNVTWETTHSLFLTTNYSLQVAETDHGTWRRLALVEFPYSFQKPGVPLRGPNDRRQEPGLRDRLRAGKGGRREAVLAWVIEGARKWYEADQVMPLAPGRVRDDTSAWRQETDQVLGFVNDRLTFDPGSSVLASELFEDFHQWQVGQGVHDAALWANNTFVKRFEEHEVVRSEGLTKKRPRNPSGLSRRLKGASPPKGQHSVWSGLRFRSDSDDLLEGL